MPLSPALAPLAGRSRSRRGARFEYRYSSCCSDETIVTHAGRKCWVVVTADLDFSRLIALAEADRPGLILFRAGDWNEEEAVARLETTLNAVPENELLTSIVVIERNKFVVADCRSNEAARFNLPLRRV